MPKKPIKPFITYSDQINILTQKKQLNISDLSYAEGKLHDIGYYSLIDGYKDIFYNPMTRTYVKGTDFTDIVALYEFDENLRSLVFKYICHVEQKIRSLIRYENVKFVLISPEELRIPSYVREDVLMANHIEFEEVERLEDAMADLDVLYMTRVQKERFFNEEDYIRLKDYYILTKQKLNMAKDDMLVLHPLPRVNEISVEVDDDPRAAYFKQAQYGVYVRMALILTLLGITV